MALPGGKHRGARGEEEEEGIRVMNYGHANALPVKETAQRPFYSLP